MDVEKAPSGRLTGFLSKMKRSVSTKVTSDPSELSLKRQTQQQQAHADAHADTSLPPIQEKGESFASRDDQRTFSGLNQGGGLPHSTRADSGRVSAKQKESGSEQLPSTAQQPPSANDRVTSVTRSPLNDSSSHHSPSRSSQLRMNQQRSSALSSLASVFKGVTTSVKDWWEGKGVLTPEEEEEEAEARRLGRRRRAGGGGVVGATPGTVAMQGSWGVAPGTLKRAERRKEREREEEEQKQAASDRE